MATIAPRSHPMQPRRLSKAEALRSDCGGIGGIGVEVGVVGVGVEEPSALSSSANDEEKKMVVIVS